MLEANKRSIHQQGKGEKMGQTHLQMIDSFWLSSI
jgi:hypothetical protein